MRVNRTYILERYYGGLVQFIKKKQKTTQTLTKTSNEF